MKRIVSSIAAVAVGLWLTAASALGLGEIEVRSHLNQRFDAVIPLTSVGAEEAADLRVSLASAEDFTRAGLQRSDYLSSLHFSVRTEGTPRIEISSEKLEREPYLQLLLEIRGGGNRILRQYTVLLDPQGMASSNPPATLASRPAPVQGVSSEPTQSIFVEVDHPTPPPDEQRVAPRAEPVKSTIKQESPEAAAAPASASSTPPAPVSGELYGPVKPGETLWSIATRVRGDHTDVSMDQVLLSLYDSNPRAFDGGINGLNRGAMLSIPAIADMRALAAADAHREVARLRGLPASSIAPAAPSRARKPVIEPARITPPPPPATTAAQAIHAQPAAPVADAKPTAAGAATMASAPAASTIIDKTVGADGAEVSTLAPVDAGQEASAGNAASESGTATDAATTESTPADGEASAPQVIVPPVEPAPPVKTKKTESLLQALLIPLILGLLLLFFLGWLFARWRARRVAVAVPPSAPPVRTRMPLSTPSASEAAIAGAAAAAATTQKLTPQEELDRLQASISGRTQDVDTQKFQTQQLGVDSATTTEVAAAAAATELPPVDFDLTGQFATQTVQIDLDANDPVSEADFHLAYGLYDEAALLLRQAAEKEPQRTDIGIKLAETYFAAGKTAEFAQTAAELKPKLSAAEWQKLAIMGQQLDPNSTAFSDTESAPLQADLDPGFDLDATSSSTASAADNDALDFNFDSESAAEPAREEVASPLKLQADNGLDFKLDDLELPSLDVDKHDASAAPSVADGNALDFDLGGFDAAAVPAAASEPSAVAAEPAAHDASSTLDFDLGEFDVGTVASDAPAPLASEPAAEAPIEEFDFGTVSTEAGELAGDEAATKLDLARAYLEMGDSEMARGLLDEVLEQGNAQQKQDAKSLIDRLA